ELDRLERVGHILEGGDDGCAVLGGQLIPTCLRGALFLLQGESIENRLRDVAHDGPELKRLRTLEEVADVGALAADVAAGEVEDGYPVGDGDADQGTRRVQVGLGGANIRALLHDLRGEADGQFLRQVQRVEVEALGNPLAREMTRQRRQQITLHGELLLQRRQRLLGRRERGLLRRDVDLRHLPSFKLLLEEGQKLFYDFDDLFRRIDLAAYVCLLHGRQCDVRGQRQIGRLECKALRFLDRLQRFDLAHIHAEHVRHIGNRELARLQRKEWIGEGGRRYEHRGGLLLPRRIVVGGDGGEERPGLR